MKKRGAVLLVALLGAGTAGCDGALERISAPDEARRGGNMYGGGNRTDGGVVAPDSTMTTNSTADDAPCLEERGGGMFGGGNLTEVPDCSTP